jgi:putative copper export protein
MDAKPLFEWTDVLFEYVGFLSSFAMLGAVGFRYGIRRAAAPGGEANAAVAESSGSSFARAGLIGFLGASLGVVSLVEGLLKRADAKHQAIGEALAAGGATSFAQVGLLAVLLVAFALAWRRVSVAWPIAGICALALALRGLLSGRLAGMVNPLHVLGASLWLGTLFVMVVCGVGEMVRSTAPSSERERAVAEMVRGFSTLGLTGAGLLGLTGLVTSWNHLNPLAALWTTPYGYALMAKLFVVAIVVGLGAWNWRRVGPSLGHDGGALAIRRTATTELGFAAVVLLFTAILVSVPSPKAPARAARPAGADHATSG